MALIAKAAVTDWKAAAWRLERKWPRRYGPRVAVSVQQELEAVLDRLKTGLEPAAYEKAAAVHMNRSVERERELQAHHLLAGARATAIRGAQAYVLVEQLGREEVAGREADLDPQPPAAPSATALAVENELLSPTPMPARAKTPTEGFE